MKVLVLGATGFVGRQALIALQRRASIEVVAGCRNPERLAPFEGEVRVGDLVWKKISFEVVAGSENQNGAAVKYKIQ